MTTTRTVTAFTGHSRLAFGAPGDVFVAVRALLEKDATATVVVFDDDTGHSVDADLRGSDADIRARFPHSVETDQAQRGPGRPKLGVIAREVTLLPRHWDWLSKQKGGASVTLRRLVEEAQRAGGGRDVVNRARETADRFMTTIAGNFAGYENAARALYAGDGSGFTTAVSGWPNDIAEHAKRLAAPAFTAPGP